MDSIFKCCHTLPVVRCSRVLSLHYYFYARPMSNIFVLLLAVNFNQPTACLYKLYNFKCVKNKQKMWIHALKMYRSIYCRLITTERRKQSKLRLNWENYISISFHSEWDMIVGTVFLSILNQMEFYLVQNRKENSHHDHIPFDVKGNGNIVFSVYEARARQ